VKRIEVLLIEARGDVASRARSEINRESAWRWATLAVAASERRLFSDAVDYAHEAVEHAAQADETGAELRAVRDWLRVHAPPGIL